MKLLYKIGIRAYGLGVLTAGMLGKKKAVQWVEGRKNWQNHLSKQKWEKPIWVHASSLGEFEQARPLIEMLKADPAFTDKQILVSFFSPSGYEFAKHFELADHVTYLPLDTASNARSFLDIVDPSIAIFVKYDFWFNFLKELQKRNTPTLYFGSNFREGQFYFKKLATWQRKIMQGVNFIYCLNEKSEEVLKSNGFINTGVCGDTRFDRVIQNTQRSVDVPVIEKCLSGERKVLILGSSWPPEEELIANYLKSDNSYLLDIIIAPHDITESHLQEIERKLEGKAVRYSSLERAESEGGNVILIDNIGMLSNLYQYGDLALIGGGFTNGLHNILEACAFGNTLLYGANISKYPEGIELQTNGGASYVSLENFEEVLNTLVKDEEKLNAQKRIAKDFVFEHKGATKKVYEKVKEMISQP